MFEIYSRTNVDSEEEGIFTVSCAGGSTAEISANLERISVEGTAVRLTIDALKGGHSGAEIHMNRANANKAMGSLLKRILDNGTCSLVRISGGNKGNAIPRTCQADIVVSADRVEDVMAAAADMEYEIRNGFDEPEAVVWVEILGQAQEKGLSCKDSSMVIELLEELPNGVQSWSSDISGLVQTSLNLGILRVSDTLDATISVRSSVMAEREALMERICIISDKYAAKMIRSGDYPAWEYRKDSHLRDTMVKVYIEQYGCPPEIMAIHAGLECGLLSQKLPGLDCISIGPNMHDIHTTREKLEIASVERVWTFLQNVLQAL